MLSIANLWVIAFLSLLDVQPERHQQPCSILWSHSLQAGSLSGVLLLLRTAYILFSFSSLFLGVLLAWGGFMQWQLLTQNPGVDF